MKLPFIKRATVLRLSAPKNNIVINLRRALGRSLVHFQHALLPYDDT